MLISFLADPDVVEREKERDTGLIGDIALVEFLRHASIDLGVSVQLAEVG